jgi:hypothetical protein
VSRSWCLAAGLAAALAVAGEAAGCPVCYGEASGSVIDGTRLSIAFLGSLVYLVLAGGVGMVFVVRRRARRLGDPRHGLKLIKNQSGRVEPTASEEPDPR